MKRMRHLVSLLLVAVMVLSLVACGNKADSGKTETDGGAAETKAEESKGAEEETSSGADANGKIGLMVGTVAISEEEYRSAEAWQKQLGEDKVVIQTYPDNFMSEEETTISNMLSLVSDPDIKVVVFVQGVPGASAAIAKAKKSVPTFFILTAAPTKILMWPVRQPISASTTTTILPVRRWRIVQKKWAQKR